MITRSTLIVGLAAAGAFAFSPLVNAQHHGGGGRAHSGGAHFQGTSGGNFSHGAGVNRGGTFNRSAHFNRGSSFGRNGNFNQNHNGHGHHGHFRHGVFFVDPFYYGYGYGYPFGYGYGSYGYDSYYASANDDEGGYANENYSAEVDAQSALADLGYYKGEIDGVVGSGTRRAVRAFQRNAGLPVTGRIDGRLLNALRES